MSEYRFLLSGRWVGWLAIAIVFAFICSLLGLWQLDRRAETVETIDRVANNYDAAPVPFAQVEDQFASFDLANQWLPVQLRGEYLPQDTRIVRNRPLSGQPGYEVLVPFRTQEGPIVVVDRGWLPIGRDTSGAPDEVPAPPSGTVDVVARFKHVEGEVDRTAPEGQLASVNLEEYAAELPYPIQTDAYVLMDSEDPPAAQTPVAFPKPSIDEGPNLSYAMQWFAFGVLGFVGLIYAARRQAFVNEQDEIFDDQDIPAHLRSTLTKRPSRRTKRTSEDEEDELLDAAGYR